MKQLRSHTIQGLVALLICLGIGFQWVKPAQLEQNSRSFANWLTTVMKNRDDARLLERIRDLKQGHRDLNQLLREASQLVSSHNDEFDLPLEQKKSSSDDISKVLLLEWNMYKKVGGMGQATQKPTVKPILLQPLDKSSGTANPMIARTSQPVSEIAARNLQPLRPTYHRTPHAGGTAIGAP